MIVNIGGDFCITPEYLAKDLFDQDIINFFKKGDLNIVNLECPVYNVKKDLKIEKTGPHLVTDERIFNRLKEINIHAVTLANNHILDYGKEGLESTINGLKLNSIQYVGAGVSKEHASRPLIIKKGDIKIAFINICENEWSVANEYSAGANGLDFIDNFNQIKLAKQEADFVIVIAHGGHEYYNLPSPGMVKQYHFYAENGADAVISHHTHCFSGFEYYNNVPIAYGLGNMLFTLKSNRDEWYTGLIAQLHIKKNLAVKIEFIPIKQNLDTYKLHLLSFSTSKKSGETFNHLNEIINNKTRLLQEWEAFILSNSNKLKAFNAMNAIKGKVLRGFLKLLLALPFFQRKQYLRTIYINFRCESHRELNFELFKRKFKN